MFLGLCYLSLLEELSQKCSAWKMNLVLLVSLVWAQSFANVCFTAGFPQKNTPTRVSPTSACSIPHNTLRFCEGTGLTDLMGAELRYCVLDCMAITEECSHASVSHLSRQHNT
jgi:hypothetical protein